MQTITLAPSRQVLEANAGRKLLVVAVYAAMGTKKVGNRAFHTVLLRWVREASTGTLLADHLWFNRGNAWRKAGLVHGDVIAFEARPIEYRTGYWGPDPIRRLDAPPRRDYRLTPPTEVRIVRRACRRVEAA